MWKIVGFRPLAVLVLLVPVAVYGLVFGKLPSVSAAPTTLNLSRIPWEGGPAYWKTSNGPQFAKADAAGWDDPSFFPIAVWLSNATDSVNLKAAGINTYVGVNHNAPMTDATDEGMFAIAQGDWLGPEWTQAEIGNNPNVVGWLASDECEMGYSGCEFDHDGDTDIDEADRLAVQQDYVDQIDSFNDGRFKFANFGNGARRTFWGVNTTDEHIQLMDAAGFDQYMYTSESIQLGFDGVHNSPDWPDGIPTERAYGYGFLMDQMRRFTDPNDLHPMWGVFESAQPLLAEPTAREILPDEMEGAIWSSLIHEARGILYFQQNNGTVTCVDYHSLQWCPAVRAKVTAVNAKIQSLAPVLNTQSYYNDTLLTNGHTRYFYNFNNGTDTMLKTYNGHAYIFAGLGMHCTNASCTSGAADSTGSKTFTLPTGVNGTSVEVVGESRTLSVNASRQFTDSFAQEYTHHVYKVGLGVSTSDYDGDGTADSAEDGGTNGDNNGDGTGDSEQVSVSSGANSVAGGHNAIRVSGGTCSNMTDFDSMAESSLGSQDTANDYPVGLWDFKFSCSAPGGSANVTIYLDKSYDTSKWTYRKYNSATQAYTTIPVTYATATVGSKTVTTISFTGVDGGPLDQDGAANGTFHDPSGPSVLAGTAPNTGLEPQSPWLSTLSLAAGTGLAIASFTYWSRRRGKTKTT